LPVQSPTMGRSPGRPYTYLQVSSSQPSSDPFPLRSRNHAAVLESNTPKSVWALVHGPVTGMLPCCPKFATQESMLQPSKKPLPSRSRINSPVLGRKTPTDTGIFVEKYAATVVLVLRATAQL